MTSCSTATAPITSPSASRIGTAENSTCNVRPDGLGTVRASRVRISSRSRQPSTSPSPTGLPSASLSRTSSSMGSSRPSSSLTPVRYTATGFMKLTRPSVSVAMTASTTDSSVIWENSFSWEARRALASASSLASFAASSASRRWPTSASSSDSSEPMRSTIWLKERIGVAISAGPRASTGWKSRAAPPPTDTRSAASCSARNGSSMRRTAISAPRIAPATITLAASRTKSRVSAS